MMRNNKLLLSIPVGLLLVSILACKSLPFFNEPTPFAFPTADLTLTAIFAILEESPTITAAPAFTSTPVPASPTSSKPPTEGSPSPTGTLDAAVTSTQTATAKPPTSVPIVVPTARPGNTTSAAFMGSAPVIDGMLGEWSSTKFSIDQVVYGKDNWSSDTDHSGWFMIGWDWNNLYIGAYIRDTVYVQNASGDQLYKGDSVEVLLDANLLGDYYLAELSADDYQIGLSPGKPNISVVPEAFVWFPSSKTGGSTDVKVDARASDEGYVLEASIAWKLFGISPAGGQRYGFCLSSSDNDNASENVQQSMISNVSTRWLTDPKTWGNLILKNP
jgi:hypothetical protein